jgi:hypothetical protein
MNFTRYDQDGLELFINMDGAVFTSQRALARICKISEMAIRKWITANQISILSAEIQTETGLKTANLLNEKVIGMALIRYNPDLAQKCFEAGLRVMLYGFAGLRLNSTRKTLKPLQELSSGELQLLRAYFIAEQAGKPIDISHIIDPVYLSASLSAVTYAMWIKDLADTKLMIQAAKIGNKHIHRDARIPLSELESRQKDLEHSINHDDFGFFKDDFEEFQKNLQALNTFLSDDLKALAS